MTRDALLELKKLAEAATPGPWWIQGAQSDYELMGAKTGSQNGWALGTRIMELDTWKMEPSRANAEFIAAANPSTILALIAEIEKHHG